MAVWVISARQNATPTLPAGNIELASFKAGTSTDEALKDFVQDGENGQGYTRVKLFASKNEMDDFGREYGIDFETWAEIAGVKINFNEFNYVAFGYIDNCTGGLEYESAKFLDGRLQISLMKTPAMGVCGATATLVMVATPKDVTEFKQIDEKVYAKSSKM